MYNLSKEEKLRFIIEKSKELGISPYEYGQNTDISDLGARNILTGESKNPRTKNLNIMLKYLESKVVGTALEETNKVRPINEPYTEYNTNSLEDIIFRKMLKKLQPEFEKRDAKILTLRKDLKRIHDQLIMKDLKEIDKNKKSSAS